jgi:hypothetical protein
MTIGKFSPTLSPPPKALLYAVATLAQAAHKAGVLKEGSGLGPTGVRVRLTRGSVTVTDGPFTEAKAVAGGYAIYEVKSQHEAVEWAQRVVELHRRHWPGFEGEFEIRPMVAPPGMESSSSPPPGCPEDSSSSGAPPMAPDRRPSIHVLKKRPRPGVAAPGRGQQHELPSR